MLSFTRTTGYLCIAVLLLAGCRAAPKVPRYDDRDLRPINADLVSWLGRLKATPEKTGAVAAQSSGSGIGPQAQTFSAGTNAPRAVASPASPTVATTSSGAGPTGTSPIPTGNAAATAATPVGGAAATAPLLTWVAPAGTTPRQTLQVWSAKAGWTLVWNATTDGPPTPAFSLSGEFLTALSAFQRAAVTPYESTPARLKYPLHIEAFTRQKVIQVTDRK